MEIMSILIAVAITSVLWIAYIKFYHKTDRSKEQDELKNKDHEIEILRIENDKELSILNEKINSLQTTKNTLETTLATERKNSAQQLSTLKNVDSFKNTVTSNLKNVTSNMDEYSRMIQKQQDFIDKLTGNAKYQGDFGEKFLEQSLQFHGFKLNIDYTKQKKEEVYNLEEDKSQTTKPDIVLNLSDNTHIICDSKVSLDNWKKFINSENDQERDEQFKKHYLAVKKHIDDLSKKDYMKNLKKEVFQKVIMYMCHEAAYLAALEHDPGLYDYAYKKNILLVGPKNLLAIISIAQTIKDKEKQINSVKEITNTAVNLMEKYSLLKGHLIKTMSSFNSHGDNLKKVLNNAYQGRNSLEKRIEKLQDLGINSSNPIPKTSEVQDKLMEFEEPKTNDNKDLIN
tara:strand:+ start:1436 stop:2632 length:1197 start_codon:yes stop_codon:yes gene_type:complete